MTDLAVLQDGSCSTFLREKINLKYIGNHHVDLGQVISTYYKVLYPEELQKIPDLALREMLQRGTLFERDEVMMDELVAEGTIRREDAALTLETIIALHERYLHQASLLKKRRSSSPGRSLSKRLSLCP